MKLAFQRMLTSWLVLAACVSIALAAGWSISIRKSAEHGWWVEHTHEVLYELQAVAALMDESVFKLRGYDLTREGVYLEQHRRSLPAIDAGLRALRDLTADNASQQRRLADLEALVAERLKGFKQTLAEIRRGEKDTFPRWYLGKYGEGLRVRIREAVAEIEAKERRLLGLRTRAVSSSRWWSFAFFMGGTTVNLAILFWVFRIIGREIGRRGETEQRLRQGRARFQGIFDASTLGIALVDLTGKWLEVNRSLCAILGYSKEELLAADSPRLIHPDDLAADHAAVLRFLDGEATSYQRENRYIHKQGHELWIARSVSLVRDESGRPLHFVSLMEDITPRKQAERVLTERTRELEAAQTRLSVTAEFASALNQEGMLDAYRGALGCLARATEVPLSVIYDAPDGSRPVPQCAVGPDHRPLGAAQFAGDGLPATVVRTRTAQTLFGPFDAAELRIHFGLGEVGLRSVTGWPIVYMGRCLGALVTAHTAPLAEEQGAFIRASLAQLAIRMNGFQVEQQRLRLVADLRAQSGDLQAQSVALDEARREAERASRAKSEFLANMSHELRTPMNSIMGFTQRLITKLGDTIAEREMNALLTVDRNAKHLLVLINDILDLAKIEAGKMDLNRSRLDLASVVREVADQAAPLTDNKPVEVRLELPDGPLMLDGDRVRLRQVVTNLLSNAIKYTNAGTVTIAADEADDPDLGRVLRVAVRDTGVGIKPEDLGRLFQQFTQLDGSTSRKIGGTGLGLAISAHYVRMHGGRIDVASEFGQGTVFTILLPLVAKEAAPAPGPIEAARPRPNGVRVKPAETVRAPSADALSTPEPRCPGIRILCVDDEHDVLAFLQMTFEDAGYDVMLAGDHDDALAEAKSHRPDLICLDLNLPGKDGFEVLKSLRADPALCDIPVIVVSVSGEEAQCLAGGALRYLAKPVAADDLMATVRDVLAGAAGSVLIVEDNPDIVRLYADLLAEGGLDVRTASNGREGLDRLAERLPSVIVLDLMMPVMDGFTFLDHLQGDPVWGLIPVIILTAMTLSPEETARLERSGAAILIKGRDATEQVVDSILHLARTRRGGRERVAP